MFEQYLKIFISAVFIENLALAFFWGCAPLGDAALTAQLDQVAAGLRVG